MKNIDGIVITKELQEAIRNNKPVVALESTIISHGMPYPRNVSTAIKVEEIIREKGAVPATIAIINGKPTVGISHSEIEHLGKKGADVTKVSSRDIAIISSKGEDGATTVAGTMIIAELVGIRVFATGGIGGVHRGAEFTMDISADLQELGRSNIAVICAGAKSILDIGLTIEYLETKGVTVIGYGTDTMPEFYTREGSFPVNYRVDSALDIAKIIAKKKQLNISGGIVIANPIPKEYSLNKDYIDRIISDACVEARENGIKGKEITPFLLGKIQQKTSGNSLESNIALIYNNARLGAMVARELCSI